MKYIIWFFVLISLSSCRGDIVDVSRLNGVDKLLFAEAASREGVSITNHGQPWDWSVRYNNEMSDAGLSTYDNLFSAGELYCLIEINPNNLKKCSSGGVNQHFMVVSRHELKHCSEGNKHNQNPQSLMYIKGSPCWPID